MKVLLCFETHLLAEGVLKLLLQLRSDVQVELARPGFISSEQIIAANYDLLLLDIDFFSFDPTTLLTAIKKKLPSKKVVYAFEKFESRVLKAYRNGLDGSFLKNDSSDEVLSALTAVLGDRVHVPQSIIMNILCEGFVFTDLDTRLNQLTRREIIVLTQIASGSSMKEAARTLQLAPSTLSAHKQRIMKKLALANGQEFNSFIRAFGQLQKSPARSGEAEM
jgi:DNA-binding NarL/FixJ family response regulator